MKKLNGVKKLRNHNLNGGKAHPKEQWSINQAVTKSNQQAEQARLKKIE